MSNKISFAETMFLGGTQAQEKESAITIYRNHQKKDEYFKTTFTQFNVDGQLIRFDGKLKIIMDAKDINGTVFNPRHRADKLRMVYGVKVREIDEANGIVYVSQQSARQEQKPVVIDELDKKLEQAEQVVIKGKVIKIKAKENGEELGVWMDLCGVGIMGYVYIGNWKPTFTQSLKNILKYGDIYDVVVKEKITHEDGFSYYICSRKELIADPWNAELEKKYHVGDIIKLTCSSLEKTHWFGEAGGLENIQVFAEYPSSIHDFKVEIGKEYLGKIYHMDVSKHSLKARVFMALNQ